MTVEDAINLVNVLTHDLALGGNEDRAELVSAGTRLVSHVRDQALEVEREGGRRQVIGHIESVTPEDIDSRTD